jgi:aspartate-semialdehyde dehydrogenase
MLMATVELFPQGWVQWVNSSTYQAASGAGAKNMRETGGANAAIGQDAAALLKDPLHRTGAGSTVMETVRGSNFRRGVGAPLAAS